ncbi:MAG: menaquinone reductase molybdopterin-binding-like subunit QrcB [Thermodesulfobacteriota bacterium]|nr:menaquinone reductase molybdopterin-binding-like subunit QrcB [Thermodesulfobacteriota bacterium]
MKIDRRSFLALVGGGAVGTALTPLPIKLTDDISIWSQSFRGLPNEVPVPADGAASYHPSVCTLCPGGCGISVRKIDDRAVKVEGAAGFPVNNGGVCALGLSGLQLLYGPWRVQAPKKKENGTWKTISWSQAMTEIADKLNKLRQAGRAHAIAGIARTEAGTVPSLLKRLLTACGSNQFFAMPAVDDTFRTAAAQMRGNAAAVGFDFENSSFVLSLSAGLLDGWGAPVRMIAAHSQWRNTGAKLVQVEPRLSNTAAKADQWVAINPGTEGILVLGLAHVIVRDGLYDRAVTQNSESFDALKALLKKDYAPGAVAKATGIGEPVIEQLAKDFAMAANPVAVCGRGSGREPAPVKEVMAVLALNALVGSINRRGGVFTSSPLDYIQWEQPVLDDMATKGLKKSAIDGLHKLPEALNKANVPSIEALIVAEANPVYGSHDAGAMKAAFEQIPLVISLSAYMDETAALADYVLPLHNNLERLEDVPVSAGLKTPVVGLAQPVVKPQLDTMHPGDAILKLASEMGGSVSESFKWRDYKECLKSTFGDDWRALAKDGYIQKTLFGETMDAERLSKRIDFGPLLKSRGAMSEVPGDKNQYPLVLVGYDTMRIAAEWIGTPPFALKTVSDMVIKDDDIFVEVNPATARTLGLKTGKAATLETPAGKARVRVNLSDGIVPGVVAMAKGFGHTAYDRYIAKKGVNTNTLIGPVEDAVSGQDVAWGIRAQLKNA